MRRCCTARAPALAIAILVAPLAARAETPEAQPSTPIELPEVVVPLPEEEPAAEDSVVRRAPTGALTVVDVRARAAEARDAGELIASAPGVHLQQIGGIGQKATVMLRGASSSGVRLMLDGIPLNGAGGIADLSLLPVALVDRFEILRGGTGGTLGSGGLGGAVNAVSRRIPSGGRVFGELRYGSFDTAIGSLGAAGPLLGGDAMLVLHGTRSDGDFRFSFDEQPSNPDNALTVRTRTNNAAQLGGGLAKWTGHLGGWTTSALVEGLLYERGLAGTSRNPTFDVAEAGHRLTGAARASGELGSGQVSARAHLRTDRVRLRGGIYTTPLEQDFSAAGLSVDGAWGLGAAQLISASAEAGWETVSTAPEGGPSLRRLSAVIADEVLLLDGRLTLAPALRLEQVAAARVPEGARPVDYLLLSPQLGAALLLPGGFELRANAGRSQRPPSMLELYVVQGTLLPNSQLRPETAWHADAGASWSAAGAQVIATAYYGLYEDLIAYEYYPPFLARPRNIDRAVVGGAELEGFATLPATLRLEGSYTLTLSRNLRDDARFLGKELPNRPRHRGSLRAYAGPDWLRGRLELDARSSQNLNRTGTLQLPARWLFHAGLTSQLLDHPELALSADVRNLLDVQTEDFDGYPLPGRSFHLTLSVALEPRP